MLKNRLFKEWREIGSDGDIPLPVVSIVNGIRAGSVEVGKDLETWFGLPPDAAWDPRMSELYFCTLTGVKLSETERPRINLSDIVSITPRLRIPYVVYLARAIVAAGKKDVTEEEMGDATVAIVSDLIERSSYDNVLCYSTNVLSAKFLTMHAERLLKQGQLRESRLAAQVGHLQLAAALSLPALSHILSGDLIRIRNFKLLEKIYTEEGDAERAKQFGAYAGWIERMLAKQNISIPETKNQKVLFTEFYHHLSADGRFRGLLEWGSGNRVLVHVHIFANGKVEIRERLTTVGILTQFIIKGWKLSEEAGRRKVQFWSEEDNLEVDDDALEQDRIISCLWHQTTEKPVLPSGSDLNFSTWSENRANMLETALRTEFSHLERK